MHKSLPATFEAEYAANLLATRNIVVEFLVYLYRGMSHTPQGTADVLEQSVVCKV